MDSKDFEAILEKQGRSRVITDILSPLPNR